MYEDEFEEFRARSYSGGMLPTMKRDRALEKYRAYKDKKHDNITTKAHEVSKSYSENVNNLYYSHDQLDQSSHRLNDYTNRVQDAHEQCSSTKAQNIPFVNCKHDGQDISCHSLDNIKEPIRAYHSYNSTVAEIKKACSSQRVALPGQDRTTKQSDQRNHAATANLLHNLLDDTDWELGDYRSRVSSMPSRWNKAHKWKEGRAAGMRRNFRVSAPHGEVFCGSVSRSPGSSASSSRSNSQLIVGAGANDTQQMSFPDNGGLQNVAADRDQSQMTADVRRYTVIMLGDICVGKSSIIRSFIKSSWSSSGRQKVYNVFSVVKYGHVSWHRFMVICEKCLLSC